MTSRTRNRILFPSLALIVAAAAGTATTRSQSAWKPVEGRLMTRFAANVTPDRAWPDYPRPQLVRSRWLNLNGLWQYAITPKDAPAPGPSFDGRILVPFAVESALSGVGKPLGPDQRLWYRRTFRVPPSWKGQRVWLRFDAVDWEATVTVNGKPVGTHTGGYDGFAFDITDALAGSGDQELVVRVWDPSDAGPQPRGKQVLKPRSIWYTPTSGIWQTVWLEPLPAQAIDRLKLTPDADAGSVTIEAGLLGATGSGFTLRAAAVADGKTVATAEAAAGTPVTLRIPQPRLWAPQHPFLYDLAVSLTRGRTVVDTVQSYVGLRKISIGRDSAGVARLLLNNQPLFQYGFLDQGFWPESLHTPPTDEAIRFDIASTLGIGMNLARKHIKIESERWYYWADTLGLLVWQDMPSGGNTTPESRVNFADEWRRLIDARCNHPSIVMWVPFNEGWGQPDAAGTREMAAWTARYDPTRLVNNTSGWTDAGAGHTTDIHQYPGPSMPALERGRAAVLGEFGGLGLPTRGHTWQDEKNWGYVSFKDAAEYERAYRDKLAQLRLLVARGLSAAVYTQTTDVEIETNGLLTYDREVFKISPSTLVDIHKTLYNGLPDVTTVLPTSELDGRTWRFTFTDPVGAAWTQPGFDDGAWQAGPAPFGGGKPEGVPLRTAWTTPGIWARQRFDWAGGPSDHLYLVLAHDEDVAVFINGVQAATVAGHATGYVMVPVSDAAAASLKPGANLVAVHCRQTRGAQAIDVGIVRVAER